MQRVKPVSIRSTLGGRNCCYSHLTDAAAAAKLLQSCPTLRDSMDCSLPGSSVHGIFQARVLEWVAIAFSDLTDDSLTIMCIETYYVAVALPADFFHTSYNLILSTIGSHLREWETEAWRPEECPQVHTAANSTVASTLMLFTLKT